MKFGPFSVMNCPNGTDQQELDCSTIEQIQDAKELGLAKIWFTEGRPSTTQLNSSSLTQQERAIPGGSLR